MDLGKVSTKKVKAYTLTEILAIIGILILLALPNSLPLITKAKTTEVNTFGRSVTVNQSAGIPI